MEDSLGDPLATAASEVDTGHYATRPVAGDQGPADRSPERGGNRSGDPCAVQEIGDAASGPRVAFDRQADRPARRAALPQSQMNPTAGGRGDDPPNDVRARDDEVMPVALD